jgi:hypothetical protein
MMSAITHAGMIAVGPNLPDLLQGSRSGPGSGGTVAVVLMSILGVVLVVVLWAVFVRKPARANERGRLVPSSGSGTDESTADGGRRRRRRRERRGRNPTLSQTGGLPPLKNDDSRPPTP